MQQVDQFRRIIWGFEAKAFPGPIVEFVHDVLDLLVCERLEVGALGQLLSNESVGVLVESTLQGMAGVGEVPFWASSSLATV